MRTGIPLLSNFPKGFIAALTLTTLTLTGPSPAQADEAQAKELVKAMSDFMDAQPALSFDFDSSVEVVTSDGQKLAIASSGSMALARPDQLHATRTGGFAAVELGFDGKTVTMLNRTANSYATSEVPGSIDHLIAALRDTYGRPLPGADLLTPGFYAMVMPLVTDTKDLGSGVIGGKECDHIALRAGDVDLQLWIAQGAEPYPCRYSVTSVTVAGQPQYSVDLMNFTAAATVEAIALPADATKVDPKDLADFDEIAGIFAGPKGN